MEMTAPAGGSMLTPEVTVAALLLVGFLAALFAHDWTRRARNRRLLYVQLVVFASGAVLIVFPEIARRLAHLVGIGRGVDFVIYPVVIWLVRESLLSRRRQREEEERLTELVRAMAIDRAEELPRVSPSGGV
jgi:small membrane protein